MRAFITARRTEIISILIFLITLSPFLFSRRFILENPKPDVETIARYPKPEYAKILSLGYDALLADFLFAKAQYYFGRHYVTDKTYHLLADMIKVIMALNPSLDYPIKFADSAITSMGGEESLKLANELLKTGEELFPDDYYFVFQQGFNYYFYLKDYKKAYPYMYKAANMESAPEHLYWLVSKIMTKGGGYRLGYEYTKMKYEQAVDKHMKDFLYNRLQSFKNLYDLTRTAQRYTKEKGRPPDRELRKLVSEGYISELPEEPYEGSYYYDKKDGKVKTTSEMYEKNRKK